MSYKWIAVQKKRPVEVIREGAFGGTYFTETFILVLLASGTKDHRKNLISLKILIRSFIVQIIMMPVLINIVLNAEHR